MSGRFIVETDEWQHDCNPPMMGSGRYSEPEAGVGSVWECECGRRFIVRPKRPFPVWRRLRWWHRVSEAPS